MNPESTPTNLYFGVSEIFIDLSKIAQRNIFNQNYVVDGKIVKDEKNQDSKSNLWFHLDYYEVINRILKSSSFKLNWVLDPFMNSGSVGLVSKKSGRRFIGFESNQDKLLLSMKRINEGE